MDFDPSRFSKTSFLIGGITVYVYNAEPLAPYLASLKHAGDQPLDVPIDVLYLVHGRGNSHTSTESFGYRIADRYHAARPAPPLVFVTFDVRNHGARTVDPVKNQGWKSNPTHAADMVSAIDGTVADLKLIMDFLPAYLNVHQHLAHVPNYSLQFRNIVSGYSLGGHTVYRFAARHPHLVHAINPVIGSCDLSSLLIDRLLKTSSDKRRFLSTYDELGLNAEQARLYPKELHDVVAAADAEIFDQFPSHLKMFAAFGAADPLVPHKYSRLWTNMYVASSDVSEAFVQEDVGHDVTEQMLDRFAAWLSDVMQ